LRTRFVFLISFLTILFGFAATSFSYEVLRTAGGIPLRWNTSRFPIPFVINQNVSDDVSADAGIQAVRNAFQGWQDVPTSSITFRYGGTTPQTNVAQDSANLVVWSETTFSGDPTTLALTTTTYYSATGEIIDGDINLNGVDYTWGANGEPDRFDIWDIVAHESGHFCGLDHSPNTDATMFATASRGETIKRTLSDDDKAGITFLYPGGSTVGNGDIDHSGRVDGWDLFLLGLSFGSHSGDAAYNRDADINGDGQVDGNDLTILANNFGDNV
jgi:hypothetical protein